MVDAIPIDSGILGSPSHGPSRWSATFRRGPSVAHGICVSPDSAEGILQIIPERRPVTIDRLWFRLVERVGRETGTK
jgi:hypothetical protein